MCCKMNKIFIVLVLVLIIFSGCDNPNFTTKQTLDGEYYDTSYLDGIDVWKAACIEKHDIELQNMTLICMSAMGSNLPDSAYKDCRIEVFEMKCPKRLGYYENE